MKQLFYKEYIDLLSEHDFREMQLPRLVPEEVLDRVADELIDFRDSVYWTATREEDEYTKSPYFLNPTSDSVLNYALSPEINSKSDLPIKIYMREQLFRPHGSTATRPFIDSDEIVDIVESYSIQSDYDNSIRDFNQAVSLLETFMSKICLDWCRIKRPPWGNKPVADRVHSLQTFLPALKCGTRIGTVYHHDQTFSKIFDVNYKDKSGKHPVHQTCFGFGERTLFTMLNQHMDEYGLRFPSMVAPIQVGIVPFTKDEQKQAFKLAKKMEGVRTDIDEKFNQSYQKRLNRYLESGVPLRVGIKSEDSDIEVSRRDTLERFKISPNQFVINVQQYLKAVDDGLQEDAQSLLDSKIKHATEEHNLETALEQDKLIKLPWCGANKCGKQLENRYPGEFLGQCVYDEPEMKACLMCKNSANVVGFYGRRSTTP
jgi:prolyl-tRNA synthetase